jgi:hypothetical protein
MRGVAPAVAVVAALVVAGCGSSSSTTIIKTTAIPPAQTVTTKSPPPTRTVTQQTVTEVQPPAQTVTQPSDRNGCNCSVSDLPVQCGAGLAASGGITCTLAENAFYEYWRASGGDPSATENVSAWSAQDGRYYLLGCGSGDGVVDCSDASGTDVRFTQSDVPAYTSAQAAAYAASGKLGPNG